MQHLIAYCKKNKNNIIMKHNLSLHDIQFYLAEHVCLVCDVVPLKDENVKKYIRMGITMLKIVI